MFAISSRAKTISSHGRPSNIFCGWQSDEAQVCRLASLTFDRDQIQRPALPIIVIASERAHLPLSSQCLVNVPRLDSAALTEIQRLIQRINQIILLPRNSEGVTSSMVCGASQFGRS